MARARRTYLEMRHPDSLRPGRVPAVDVQISRESPCAAELYRRLYLVVGEAYRWTDRVAWTDEQIEAHLATPGLEIWIARIGGEIAGYFELRPWDDGSVQVAYFGLLPRFVGRGIGGHLITEATRRAWALGAARVWLHTCTFDHPAALSNYVKRGYTIAREEEYDVDG